MNIKDKRMLELLLKQFQGKSLKYIVAQYKSMLPPEQQEKLYRVDADDKRTGSINKNLFNNPNKDKEYIEQENLKRNNLILELDKEGRNTD